MLAAIKKGDGGDGAKKPGGALMGGLGGLTGVGSLRSKMTNKFVPKVDEAVWKSNLVDMHRVRNMARTLWLSLEHTNEAVMRVALEIVTCRKARKVLWWNDCEWASEDGKPEHMRGVIEEKFDAILQYLGKELKERPAAGEAKGGPSNRELELEKQNGELQKKLRMAELQLAEMKRQLEQELQAARDRIAQLEKSGVSRGEAAMQAELERLRALEQEQADLLKKSNAELQEYVIKNAQLEAVIQEKLAEVERARKEAEDAKEAARQQAADLDRLRLEGAGAAGAQLQKELDDLRKKNDQLLADAAKLKAQIASAQAEVAKLKAGRNVERRESQEASPEDKADLERLRRLEAEWNSRGETCCKCGKACMHCTGTLPIAEPAAAVQDCASPKLKSARSNHEFEELLERKDAEIAKLKADKKKLEQERLDMLAMIDKLRNQINKLKEAAREAGHGDLVDKLMEECDIHAIMRSPEMSCFARLYQDAVRRMIKTGPNPRKDFVQNRATPKQRAVQMTQQFPGVLEGNSPGGQQFQERVLEYPHAGRHAERHAAQPVTLQSLEIGATGPGRGGGLDYHTRVDLEASLTIGSTEGGLSRNGVCTRLIATAGSLQKPGLGLDWDWGAGGGPRGSGVFPAEGTPRNWRAASPSKPLGPGFGGPASLRKAQAAHGLPRMDAPHGLPAPGGGDALKFSRSEPQLRLRTPSSLPQLAAGQGGSRKDCKEDFLAVDSVPVAWKSHPIPSKRALRAASPSVRRYQDPEPFLMISA